MQRRLTSLSKGYKHGDLSIFPNSIDNKLTLFEASNNAVTTLRHSLTPTSKYLILEDGTLFPDSGLIKLTDPKGKGEPEVIFYHRKIGNQLHMLQRGYANDTQYNWQAGTLVTSPVMAEHHNALKDAIIKIQRRIGLTDNPESGSLHELVRTLEQRWLAPKANFRAFPLTGVPPLPVRFQNFSGGHGVRYLWDFGDGTTSTEKSPMHIFASEGIYTVKLNMVSSTGAQGFTEKTDYIKVSNEQRTPFFYVRPLQGYSIQSDPLKPTEFTLVDQTDGDIVERHWFFGDGREVTVTNPNIHVIKHVYEHAGEYKPILMVKFSDEQLSRAIISEHLLVV